MKKLLLMAILMIVASTACSQKMGLVSAKRKQTMDNAMTLLNEGNQRFVSGTMIHPHKDSALRETLGKDGQYPLATVLSCSDSRVPPELVFDAGLGDLFVVRVAGQVADTDAIGSVEYAVEHLNTPVILVMAHTQCGAIKAATSDTEFHGALGSLIGKLNPAVEAARVAGHEHDISYVTKESVKMSQEQLRTSDVIRTAEENGHVRILGAVYDTETGKVSYIE